MVAVAEQIVKPYHQTDRFSLYEGDCRSVLCSLAENSIDSIVTDPPYHLTQVSRAGSPRNNDPETPYGRTRIGERGFMGKTWDGGDVAHDPIVWRECLRVLKPGGHLLAFGGSRTYHRLACAIEDAGFEIRDQIMWLYGSGFPKSLDVSKAIDAVAGETRSLVDRVRSDGKKTGHAASGFVSGITDAALRRNEQAITDQARQRDGWGTALKPAHEPIVLARKPLIGTVAENVLQHGTGGLNIDGCRIDLQGKSKATGGCSGTGALLGGGIVQRVPEDNSVGRWPANVIHDGSEVVLAGFPDRNVNMPSGIGRPETSGYGGYGEREPFGYGDSGSAARFFYRAKATQEDRNEGLENLPHRVSDHGHKRPRTELDDPRRHGVTPRQNHHPTVKPTDLMRYLCRLITPPGGVVLDPFCGSGSTGKAAMLERFRFVGIELSAEYCELAQRRIEAVTRQGILFA